MKISVKSTHVLTTPADIVVVSFYEGKIQKKSALETLNKQLKGDIEDILTREKFKGAPAQSKVIYAKGRTKATYVLVVGLGEKKNFNLDTVRKCGSVIQSVARQHNVGKVASELLGEDFGVYSSEELAHALAEGALLGGYSFERYKKSPEASPLKEIIIHSSANASKLNRAIQEADIMATAVNLARDLINTPGGDMTPQELARHAKSLKGVRTRVHNLAAIKKLKMGSFLSVGLGSTHNPPEFIEMHYTPKGKPKKRIAIVGKGVTFDTGGYSIKPAKSMETMKDDMSGAAAVIAIMSALPKLNPNVAVSGYIAATENMVSGNAQRPGDICTAMNGTTIEVLNTDAEGRLTLADAICYAKKNKPDLIIDMATLTGACLVALGTLYSGLMSNDEGLVNDLITAGKYNGENLWHLPLPEEYKEELKSPVADLKNIGGAYAGTLTAGLFLEHFVGDTKWAHIDIAGPAWTEKPLPYTPRGGTGIMVRTITHFIRQL